MGLLAKLRLRLDIVLLGHLRCAPPPSTLDKPKREGKYQEGARAEHPVGEQTALQRERLCQRCGAERH